MLNLRLTPRAVIRIAELGGVLRVSVVPGGCSGTLLYYSLAALPADELLIIAGVALAAPPALLPVLDGARLDYGTRLKPPHLRLLDWPPGLPRCACNRSFGQPFPGKVTPQCCAYLPMAWDAQT